MSRTSDRTAIRRSSRALDVAFAGVSIALMAVSAYITVPLGPVPFTLQTAVVVLVALTSSPGRAAAIMGGYLALGIVGVPVFSGGGSGMGVLVGPTGGFLVGFLVGAPFASWVSSRLRLRSRAWGDAAGAVIVLAAVYLMGSAWLAHVLGVSYAQGVAVGVLPFVLPDVAKALLAIAAAAAVRGAVRP